MTYFKSKLTRKNARRGYEKLKFKQKMKERLAKAKALQESETEFNRRKLARRTE